MFYICKYVCVILCLVEVPDVNNSNLDCYPLKSIVISRVIVYYLPALFFRTLLDGLVHVLMWLCRVCECMCVCVCVWACVREVIEVIDVIRCELGVALCSCVLWEYVHISV